MTDKQQTAVQWLVDKLIKGEFINSTDELVEQALEMELKQREEAYSLGELNAAQYFTDTYQTDEQ